MAHASYVVVTTWSPSEDYQHNLHRWNVHSALFMSQDTQDASGQRNANPCCDSVVDYIPAGQSRVMQLRSTLCCGHLQAFTDVLHNSLPVHPFFLMPSIVEKTRPVSVHPRCPYHTHCALRTQALLPAIGLSLPRATTWQGKSVRQKSRRD